MVVFVGIVELIADLIPLYLMDFFGVLIAIKNGDGYQDKNFMLDGKA